MKNYSYSPEASAEGHGESRTYVTFTLPHHYMKVHHTGHGNHPLPRGSPPAQPGTPHRGPTPAGGGCDLHCRPSGPVITTTFISARLVLQFLNPSEGSVSGYSVLGRDARGNQGTGQ